jgi:hypothetical protein
VKKDQAGFAIIGSLFIASLTSILLSVAQKATAERRSEIKPRQTQLASVLAEQKLRELDAEPLVLSPDWSLLENVTGYVDYLDKKGVVIGGGTTPAPHTTFIRRWSISPVPENPDSRVVIRVLIVSAAAREPINPIHLMMVKGWESD